jgi:hypothetical protein
MNTVRKDEETQQTLWVAEAGGVKFDMGKPQLSLLPASALNEIALVLAYGAEKYGRDNWRNGMDWTRLIDASLRHLHAFNNGEDLDPESGISHVAHAACSLMFLLEYLEAHPDFDNRVNKA